MKIARIFAKPRPTCPSKNTDLSFVRRYGALDKIWKILRGSGANSLVASLLRITNVDPIDLDLYFERFINPYRNSPPDFDVDFSWTDRDDITKYLFDTYGWDKVALLGSYQTFQRKAVIRELGKVFGLPDEEIKAYNEHLNTLVIPTANWFRNTAPTSQDFQVI